MKDSGVHHLRYTSTRSQFFIRQLHIQLAFLCFIVGTLLTLFMSDQQGQSFPEDMPTSDFEYTIQFKGGFQCQDALQSIIFLAVTGQ